MEISSSFVIAGASAIGVIAMLCLAIAALPRLDYFSLRERSKVVRIPASRVNATLILVALIAAPLAAVAALAYQTYIQNVEARTEYLLAFAAALPVYLVAINAFVSQAEYVLIDYRAGTARIRLNGLAGLIPFSTRIRLADIADLRRARETTITSDKDGIHSSTSHTLAISGAFGARDLAFESAAVRNVAERALQPKR